MTNQTNQQENVSIQSFVQIPHSLMKAKHYLSRTTGEPVKLNPSEKLVYVRMKDRWKFFTNQGKGYWDTQQQVADAVGIERKTAMAIIQNFVDHGIFEVAKKSRNNIYTIIHDLELCSAPTAPRKTPESVPPITLHPCQGLEEIVESEALVERYSEPVEVTGEVAEEDDGELDSWENDWEEDSDVVFINNTPIPVPPPTPTRDPSPAPAKDPSTVYAGDYFSDYPSKFFNSNQSLGIHHPEFMNWLNAKGGDIVDKFHFILDGIEYFIPYDPAWKLQSAV